MPNFNINRNDILSSWLATIVRFFLFFILIFGAFRAFFILYFGDLEQLRELSSDIGLAFFYGVRYDLIVISYAILPVFLLAVISSVIRSTTFKNFLNFITRVYAIILSLIFILILALDMGFYLYFQDHINILIYGIIEDDTKALIETVWKNYPVHYFIIILFLFSLLSLFVVSKITPKMKKISKRKPGFFRYIAKVVIFTTLFVGALRGGYSDVVLAPKYNDFSSNEFINLAAVNGVLALENAVKLRRKSEAMDFNLAKSLGYKKGVSEAFSDYLGLDMSLVKEQELLLLLKRRTEKNEHLEELRPHVVLIISESFGSYWNRYNSSEFNFLGGLENHFKQDYYFNNFISGANGTVGSLMIIASNIPYRPGARYLSESRYLQVPLESAAHNPYKSNGYETSFLYGGKLGWRDIGKYFRRQNFKNVIGENEIKTQLGLDNKQGTEWGLFDEHLFTMIQNLIAKAKRPQFIVALTTSNHPPFEIPKNFNGPTLKVPRELDLLVKREREGVEERFRAFQYSNFAFSNFLDFIKKSEYADRSVVAMTGDHNFWGFINFDKKQAFEKHLVPLYIYLPSKLKKEVDLTKTGSHEDIMTTLYNVTLSNTDYLSFGENLFAPSESYAINQKIYASSQGVVYKEKDYKWEDKPIIKTEASERFLHNLRRHYRSSLTVSDFFLRESLKRFKDSKDKN